MKEIKSCLTTCGKKIRIYDVHFQYPDDRFVTYWVATLEKDNYYDDNENGFLIDGKRLCFRSARNVFYDIDMLTNGIEWLQYLRFHRAELHQKQQRQETPVPEFDDQIGSSTNMQERITCKSIQHSALNKVYDLWRQGVVSFESLIEEFHKAAEMEPSMLISIDRLRSLVNEYASGAPLPPEYDFVDFVEKTLMGIPVCPKQ